MRSHEIWWLGISHCHIKIWQVLLFWCWWAIFEIAWWTDNYSKHTVSTKTNSWHYCIRVCNLLLRPLSLHRRAAQIKTLWAYRKMSPFVYRNNGWLYFFYFTTNMLFGATKNWSQVLLLFLFSTLHIYVVNNIFHFISLVRVSFMREVKHHLRLYLLYINVTPCPTLPLNRWISVLHDR